MTAVSSLTDAELLLLLLGALYLVESAAWVRGSAVWVVSLPGGWGWLVRPGLLFGRDPGGPVVGSVLPFGRAFLCEAWPVSVGPGGAYAYTSAALNPSGRLPQTERFVRFDEAGGFEPDGKTVLAAGRAFVTTASPAHATYVAAELSRLSALPVADRAGAVDALLARQVDLVALKARLGQADKEAGHLRWVCSGLFAQAFVVGPWWYYTFRAHSFWFYALVVYLAVFVVLWFDAAFSAYRASRALDPDGPAAPRRKLLVMLVLSPVAAMHAWGLVARHLLVGFHPVAVAGVTCPGRGASRFAGEALRDALHPVQPACPSDDPEICELEAWFRGRQAEALAGLVRSLGLDPDALAGPPDRQPDALSYCPRCADQYEVAEGVCVQCGGLALVRFGPESRGPAPDAVTRASV